MADESLSEEINATTSSSGGTTNTGKKRKRDNPNKVERDQLFLKNFSIKFVKAGPKDVFFQIEAIGIDPPIRLYKNAAQTLKNSLLECMEACDEAVSEGFNQDEEIFSDTIEANEGKQIKNVLQASIYCGKLGIYLRTYVMNQDGEWLPSKRAIKFAHDYNEFHRFVKFINSKYVVEQSELSKKFKKLREAAKQGG